MFHLQPAHTSIRSEVQQCTDLQPVLELMESGKSATSDQQNDRLVETSDAMRYLEQGDASDRIGIRV